MSPRATTSLQKGTMKKIPQPLTSPQRALSEIRATCTRMVTEPRLDLVQFGRCLHRLRKDAGITLRELGKKMDLSAAFLSDVEWGNRKLKLSDQVSFVEKCMPPFFKLSTWDGKESTRPKPQDSIIVRLPPPLQSRVHYGLYGGRDQFFIVGVDGPLAELGTTLPPIDRLEKMIQLVDKRHQKLIKTRRKNDQKVKAGKG